MTLYQKYRPRSFDEVIGNIESVQTLKNTLSKKHHSHCYLLCGPSGTGKTTLARIMANELGASGLDIREYNSSSNRGIETARDIIQQMRLMPSDGPVIVFIVDEVHKSTNDFQNAMLKPTEDTPEHVYFFFCTTDPEKLIGTLKNRFTQIKVNSLNEEQIKGLLKRILKKEKEELSDKLINAIADVCGGSARKALVILENILSIDDEKARMKLVLSGEADEEDADNLALCRALLNANTQWRDVASILKRMDKEGKLNDSESIRYSILGYMNAVLISGKLNKRAAVVLEAFSENTYNSGKFGITLACLNVIS